MLKDIWALSLMAKRLVYTEKSGSPILPAPTALFPLYPVKRLVDFAELFVGDVSVNLGSGDV